MKTNIEKAEQRPTTMPLKPVKNGQSEQNRGARIKRQREVVKTRVKQGLAICKQRAESATSKSKKRKKGSSNHMPATPEKISLCFPRCPPMFPSPELAAVSPGEVTPMMVVLLMMVMIMLGGNVSQ